MDLTPGTEECGYYLYPIIFEPKNFDGITKEQFKEELITRGIPTDDCYPPLHTLNCFRNIELKKGIDYSQGNWGGEKSNDINFPVVSNVFSRSIQFPHEILLASKNELNSIIEYILSFKQD
jgi:dTDP-4-amino-4,6-dideoxygalactose transaminase